jgi:uncharacterized protein YabE (DUF348 family)
MEVPMKEKALVVLLCLVLVVPLFAGGGNEGQGEKVEIRVLGLTDPGITAESKLAKEFTQETGIEASTRPTRAGPVEKCKLSFPTRPLL